MLMKSKTRSYPRHNSRQTHTKSPHLTHTPIPFPAPHRTLHSLQPFLSNATPNTPIMLLTTLSLLPRVHHRPNHTNHNPYDSTVQAPLRCSTKLPSISVIMPISPFPSISSASDTASLSPSQMRTLYHKYHGPSGTLCAPFCETRNGFIRNTPTQSTPMRNNTRSCCLSGYENGHRTRKTHHNSRNSVQNKRRALPRKDNVGLRKK